MQIKIPYWPLLLGPSLCFMLGFFLNSLAVASNHGVMPVLTSNCEVREAAWDESGDSIHACMTKSSRLKIFSDWVFIPGLGTASLGDGLETIYDKGMFPALFIWIALIVKDRNSQ